MADEALDLFSTCVMDREVLDVQERAPYAHVRPVCRPW